MESDAISLDISPSGRRKKNCTSAFDTAGMEGTSMITPPQQQLYMAGRAEQGRKLLLRGICRRKMPAQIMLHVIRSRGEAGGSDKGSSRANGYYRKVYVKAVHAWKFSEKFLSTDRRCFVLLS